MTQKNNEPKSLIEDDSIFQSPETTDTTQDRLPPVKKLPDEPEEKTETALVAKSKFEEMFLQKADALMQGSPFSPGEFKQFQLAMIFQARSKLETCTPRSVLIAAAKCAMLGLSPIEENGQAYFVAYGTSCELMVGYKGCIHIARRAGMVAGVKVKPVFRNDYFKYSDGLHTVLEWIPWFMREGMTESGELWNAWLVAELANGSVQHYVCDPNDFIRAEKSSKTKGAMSLWQTPEKRPIAYMKTCVRQASKLWDVRQNEVWTRLQRMEVGSFEIADNLTGEAQPLSPGSFSLNEE